MNRPPPELDGRNDLWQHDGPGKNASAVYTGQFLEGPYPDRLLLASHNRLMWFHINSGKTTVLHEGQVLGEARSMNLGF
jgi:hypothetical protein